MEGERDYREDVRIDTEQLDLEWVNQSSLYVHYAEESARARDRRDRAKQARDVKRAETDKDVRANPSLHGLEKVTDSAVFAAVESNVDYKKAVADYQNACLEADLMQVAVSGMEQRKSALENLVRLHAASYFAGPREPRDLPAAQREWIQKQHQEKGQEQARSMVRRQLNKQ